MQIHLALQPPDKLNARLCTLSNACAFGLPIASAFELPGTCAMLSVGAPELRIVRGTADFTNRELEPTELGAYQRSGEQLLFHPRGVARYLVEQNRLTIEPAVDADAEQVASLLIATALPAALWMRGDLVLHAAAAILPGESRALAFTAPSGFGKTHLLTRLLAQGANVLAEDVLCVRGGAVGSGLPGCLFPRIPGRPASERLQVDVPADRQRATAVVGALIVLTRDTDSSPRRLHGAGALQAVLASFHRPLVPRLLGTLPGLLPRVAALLQELQVYRWSPPLEGSLMALKPLARSHHEAC